jgi:hypothetical protein
MLAKRKNLISVFLSLSILTISTTADGLNCSNGQCHIDVKSFSPSKNMPNKIHTFKNIEKNNIISKKPKFLTDLDKSIQVKPEDSEFDVLYLGHSKYIQQENEILEPLTEEEMNTIVPAPEKFVASPNEQKLYYEQQKEMGLELIEPSLPMSLYYCMDNKEPVYDEESEQFNCIISS